MAYVAAGLDPARFWSLTPRLLDVELRGARERIEREEHARVRQAWLTARLSRAEKIPPLDRLLRAPERLSLDEATDRLRTMTASMPTRTWDEWLSAQ